MNNKIQLKEPFESYYYLTEDGLIYNAKTDKYHKADSRHSFCIKTIEGEFKRVSLKKLYR